MKYVRCDSHCKYPAYTQEEIDEKLKAIKDKDIQWFCSDFSGLSESYKHFNYPTNHTFYSSVVIFAFYKTNNYGGVPTVELHPEYIKVDVGYENMSDCFVYIGICNITNIIPVCEELTEYTGVVG